MTTRQNITKNFRNPDRIYSIVGWWFLSGEKLAKKRLSWQLKQLKSAGEYNICIDTLAPVGPHYNHEIIGDNPKYYSDEWWHIFEYIVQEAERLGMYVWFYDCLGWANALIHEKIMKEHPWTQGYVLKKIEIDVKNRNFIDLDLQNKAVVLTVSGLVINNGSIEKVEGIRFNSKDNKINLEVLDKYSRAVIFYIIPAGFDYLNKEAMRLLFDRTYGELERRCGKYFGKVIVGSMTDEYPLLPQWTEGLFEEFKKRKGYDLKPNLVSLYYNTGNNTAKVRFDFYDVLSTLAEGAVYKPLSKFHERHNLLLGNDPLVRNADPEQAQVGYLDYFKLMRWYSAPGCDKFGYMKPNSSIAHLYDRKRVWLEGFHSTGWGLTLEETKDLIHKFYQQGANLYQQHGIYYTTMGSWYEFAPPEPSFRQPYWRHFKYFSNYISRLSYILSQGRHICDIGVIYPGATFQVEQNINRIKETLAWMSGGFQSNSWVEELKQLYWQMVKGLELDNRDFDLIDEASIQRAKVKNGRLEIASEKYSIIIIPAVTVISIKTLNRLKEFCKNGGIIIGCRQLPYGSLEKGYNNEEVIRVMKKMFDIDPVSMRTMGEGKFTEKKGRAYFGASPDVVIEKIRKILPRELNKSLPYLHRKIGDKDVFFVISQHREKEFIGFRIHGKPIEYDCLTGEIKEIERFHIEGEWTLVEVDFAKAGGGAVIGFKPQTAIAEKSEDCRDIRHSNDSLPEYLPLKNKWKCRIIPTLDNEWGDFQYPKFKGYILPEIREFSYREARKEERKVRYSYGPYWMFKREKTLKWRAYNYSERLGIENDPVYTLNTMGYDGLRGFIPEEHIDLGKVDKGEGYSLYTYVINHDISSLFLRIGSSSMKEVWLNNKKIIEKTDGYVTGKNINLTEGIHHIRVKLTSMRQERMRMFFHFTLREEGINKPYWLWYPELQYPDYSAESGKRYFRKEIFIPEEIKDGMILIKADSKYKLYVNAKFIGEGELETKGKMVKLDKCDIRRYLKKGKNIIGIESENSGGVAGLLVQVKITLINGQKIWLNTDGTWRVFDREEDYWNEENYDDSGWKLVQIVGLPPVEPWGKIGGLLPESAEHPLSEVNWLPRHRNLNKRRANLYYDIYGGKKKVTGLYRFDIPPGAEVIKLDITGRYKVYVDGKKFYNEKTIKLNDSIKYKRECAIRVECKYGKYSGAAFKYPVRFEFKEGELKLGLWDRVGFPDYSGGIEYEQEVIVPPEYCGDNTEIDLGEVKGTAELWVNGRPQGVRLWGPYRFKIGQVLREGKNKVNIKVYNTLAPNYYRANPSPWVFQGQQDSGLLGPVKIVSGGL